MVSRRLFLGSLLLPGAALAQGDGVVALPPPQPAVPSTLLDALKRRRSTREFSPKPLPPDVLSTLLWCAFGVNRPDSGGRTAPSAHNWQEIDVYVALPQGAYRYDARRNVLDPVSGQDLRAATGLQDYASRAAVDLVYVADFARMTNADAYDRTFYSAAGAGFVAQNVYLYCASAGLACVVRGLIDRAKLSPLLGLRAEQKVLLAHSVGYPG